MARIGYGVLRKDVPVLIKEILDKAEEDNPTTYNENNRIFKDNLPSSTWIYRYMKRHPEISARTPENLGHQRTYVTEASIRKWFLDFSKFLQEVHGIDAKEFFTEENAGRIFNLYESGFPLAGTNGKLKVITTKGAKSIYRLTPDTKEQVTILGCTSAAGDFAKPYVVFSGVRPKYNFQRVNPEDYDLGRSENGWMTADCFFEWLSNCFCPSLKEKKVKFPIIILMDGHASHSNIAVSSFARQNDIILYCFPAHASHVIQPLDLAFFGPMKKIWNSALDEFSRQYKGLFMTKTHFFQVFDRAWKTCTENKQTIFLASESVGSYPLIQMQSHTTD